MYFVYILYSKNFDRYYVGQCADLQMRLARHNRKMVPSTKSYTPWTLVYFEEYINRGEAISREREIKSKKSRKYIEFLLAK